LSHFVGSQYCSHCDESHQCQNIPLCQEPPMSKYPIMSRAIGSPIVQGANSCPIVLGIGDVKISHCPTGPAVVPLCQNLAGCPFMLEANNVKTSHCARSQRLSNCAVRQQCENISFCRELTMSKYLIMSRANDCGRS